MSFSALEALEVAMAGSDNEKKVAAFNRLKSELESAQSPLEFQPYLRPIKSALESSNGHVSFAGLSCLPALVRSVASKEDINHSDLGILIQSLYSPPSGSVIGFLGDSKPRTRELARQALCGLAHIACEAYLQRQTPSVNGIKSDDVLLEIERIVKEQGFANKTARARVQAICYLSETRSRYPTVISIKTYLPCLVSLLEDHDASVRNAASEAVIAIFSDPSLPASARTDLKNELAKQATRKSTVDSILPKVFSSQSFSNGAAQGSPNGHPQPDQTDAVSRHSKSPTSQALAHSQELALGPEATPPPSMILQPIYVAGPKELENIFAKMLPAWEGKETEHNWQAREANINTLRGMLQTDIHTQYPTDFIAGLKLVSEGLLKSLASLRTTMAVGVCHTLLQLTSLGTALDPLVDVFLPPLLNLAGQTKKIVFQASQAAAAAWITTTSYHPRTLHYLLNCVSEKVTQAREAGITRIKDFVESHGQRYKSAIQMGDGLAYLDKAIRRSLADASLVVRQTAREVFWSCFQIWPAMGEGLLQSLDPTTRKQLEKASSGVSNPLAQTLGAKPTTKRVSVKSMIKSHRTAGRSKLEGSNDAPSAASSATPRATGDKAHINSSSQTSSLTSPPASFSQSPDQMKGFPARAAAHVKTPMRARSSSRQRKSPLSKSVSAQSSPSKGDATPRSPPTPLRSTSYSERNVSSPNRESKLNQSLSLKRCLPSNQKPIRRSKANDEPLAKPRPSEENVIEAALKAQAEQAESAAHRLLELAEDELHSQGHSMVNPLGPGGIPIGVDSLKGAQRYLPRTPPKSPRVDKIIELEKKYHLAFENSPAPGAMNCGAKLCAQQLVTTEDCSSVFSHRSHSLNPKNSWWHHQAELTLLSFDDDAARKPGVDEFVGTIKQFIQAHDNSQEINLKLAKICWEKKGPDMSNNFWNQLDPGVADELFEVLKERLMDLNAPENVKDSQLILLRTLMKYASHLMIGREIELCEILLSAASIGTSSVLAATEALGNLWTEITDPIYGLSCLRSCIDNVSSTKNPSDHWIGLSLTCLGEFLVQLPIEIVEEELQKSRELIKRALNHHQTDVRLKAVKTLMSCNLIVKDLNEIIRILGGNLSQSQEALLTYYLTSSGTTTAAAT